MDMSTGLTRMIWRDCSPFGGGEGGFSVLRWESVVSPCGDSLLRIDAQTRRNRTPVRIRASEPARTPHAHASRSSERDTSYVRKMEGGRDEKVAPGRRVRWIG